MLSTTSRLSLLSESFGSSALAQRFDIASANQNYGKRRQKKASFRPLNFVKYFMLQGYGATPYRAISLGCKIMSMRGLYLDGPLCRNMKIAWQSVVAGLKLMLSTTSRLSLLSESFGSSALVQRFDTASVNQNSGKRRRKKASFRPLNFVKYFMSQGYGATPYRAIYPWGAR